jgi:anti-sigma factor RsiW
VDDDASFRTALARMLRAAGFAVQAFASAEEFLAGSALEVPHLESIGLKLVGGRLLPGPTGEAAAFYMYENASGERFTVYCAKATAPESALRYRSEDRSAAFYWVDDKVAYVVSGPADREKLEKVTKTVYEQVDRSGTKKS